MHIARRFDQYLAWLNCADVELPFQFGGATQCGRLKSYNNNQDAMALWSRPDCIVGLACDGCATSATAFSNNEVGSRIISALGAELIGEACVATGVDSLPVAMTEVEGKICERIVQVAEMIVPLEQRDNFLDDFMMSTVVAFAVDKKNYAVFGCGDGLFAINGKITSLEENSGAYLAARLHSKKDWKARLVAGETGFRLYRTGETKDLQSLLVATDGFEELTLQFESELSAFVLNNDQAPARTGYWPSMAVEFQSRFWMLPSVINWDATQDGHDDRSFLLLRRLSEPGE